ncbi:hypothetical protein PS708_04679 [Pseudomonas fluorescens]|nr:hypothetical protein PS708_04679 [Pseudomonas fluorescens]
MQIRTATAQDVALSQQGRHIACRRRQPKSLPAQQQMGDTRMGRQLGHLLPVSGEFFFIQRTEAPQQILGLGIRRRRRHIQPDQLSGRDAPARQLQSQAGQVGGEDFRTAVGGQAFVLVFGPQAITHARLQAPCSTGALGGAGAGNALGIEAGHAASGVETRHPRQPGVDHDAHAVDGEAGLGNVGRQHDLAFADGRRVDGGALSVEVQFAMQRAQHHIRALAEGVSQLLVDPANLRLPRQEHQHAAGFVLQGVENSLHHTRFDEFTGLVGAAPAHLHREHAPFAAQDWRVVQQPGQAFAFEGGRHQQDFQRLIIAKEFAAVQAQGQRQVGVEAALVKLIEDQQAHAVQRRIVLQAAGEDAFGDHFDARIGADLAVQTNAIADGFTDFFTQLAGQTLGRRAGCETTGFEHQDGLPGQPGLVQQGQGHAGSFTGAGGRFQHGFMAIRQGVTQCG